MQQWNFKERRRLPRYEITLATSETDSPAHREITSTTRDICEQGIGLISSERIPFETPLEITLLMPDNQQRISVQGKVVWQEMVGAHAYRCGIILDSFRLEPISLVLRMIKMSLKSRYSGSLA